MATAADEEDYDRRAMEQAARQSGALTDAIKALGHLRLRARKPSDSMLPPITKASGIGTETTGRCLQAISAVRAFG